MSVADDRVAPPRAVIVVDTGRGSVVLAPIERSTPCELALVDHLLRLRLQARRCGWTLHLDDVDDELAQLLDLIGVSGSLVRETIAELEPPMR